MVSQVEAVSGGRMRRMCSVGHMPRTWPDCARVPVVRIQATGQPPGDVRRRGRHVGLRRSDVDKCSRCGGARREALRSRSARSWTFAASAPVQTRPPEPHPVDRHLAGMSAGERHRRLRDQAACRQPRQRSSRASWADPRPPRDLPDRGGAPRRPGIAERVPAGRFATGLLPAE